jgi:chemotaxis protein histidine kinase CheA
MGGKPYNSQDNNKGQDPNFNGSNNYGYQPVHDPTGGSTTTPDNYSKVNLADQKASDQYIPKTGNNDYPGGDISDDSQFDGSTAMGVIKQLMEAIERESEASLNTMAGLWDQFNSHLGDVRSRIVQQTDSLTTGNSGWAGWSPTKSMAAETFMGNIGKGTFSLDEWITFGQQNADALRTVASQVVTTKKAMKTRYQQWVADHNSMAATVKADKDAMDKDNKPGVVGWLSRHSGISWADTNTFRNFERQMWEIDRSAARDLQGELKKLGGAYIQAWGATNEGRKYQGPTQAVNPLIAYGKRVMALEKQAMAAAQARARAALAHQQELMRQQQQQLQRQRQQLQRKIDQAKQQEQQQLQKQRQELQKKLEQQKQQVQQQQQKLDQQQKELAKQQQQLQQKLDQEQKQIATQTALVASQRAAMQQRMADAQRQATQQERQIAQQERQVAQAEAALNQRMNGLTSNINNGLNQLSENGLTGSGVNPNMRAGINGTPVNELTGMGGAGRPNMSSLAGRSGMSGLGGGMGRGPMNPGMRGRGGMPGMGEGEGEGSPGSRSPMGGRGDKQLNGNGEQAAKTLSMPESEEHLGLNEVPTAPKLLAGRLDPNQVAETELHTVRPTMAGRLGDPGGPGGMRGPQMPGAPRGNRQLTPEELGGRRKRMADATAAEDEELMSAPTLLVPDLTGRHGLPEIDWEQVRNGELGVDEEMLGARGKPAPTPEVADPAARLARRRKDGKDRKAEEEQAASTVVAAETAEELWKVETPEVIDAPAEQRDTEERQQRGQVLGPS